MAVQELALQHTHPSGPGLDFIARFCCTCWNCWAEFLVSYSKIPFPTKSQDWLPTKALNGAQSKLSKPHGSSQLAPDCQRAAITLYSNWFCIYAPCLNKNNHQILPGGKETETMSQAIGQINRSAKGSKTDFLSNTATCNDAPAPTEQCIPLTATSVSCSHGFEKT